MSEIDGRTNKYTLSNYTYTYKYRGTHTHINMHEEIRFINALTFMGNAMQCHGIKTIGLADDI